MEKCSAGREHAAALLRFGELACNTETLASSRKEVEGWRNGNGVSGLLTERLKLLTSSLRWAQRGGVVGECANLPENGCQYFHAVITHL